jgi:tetratricopeptide (TPR) repeat protein
MTGWQAASCEGATMKTRIKASIFALLGVFLFAPLALACLWDSDTLQMERLRFPGVLEIITGKFVRHSKDYYEWRIKDRLKKLEAAPNDPALIDDLAVGYDKLGRYDEGIAVLEKSLAAHPDRYETLANLATLLFHAGRLEESKQYVQRALEINPNAHFGREKYQLLLTEYVQQSELASIGVLSSEEKYPLNGGGRVKGFARFVIVSRFGEDQNFVGGLGGSEADQSDREAELQNATRGVGVLGMLHFADHKSPILLEALGDLLITGDFDKNGTMLAARAYVLASQGLEDSAAADRLRKMAREALANQLPYSPRPDSVDLPRLEKQLAAELAEGANWFTRIESQERKWIADGVDVDQAFAKVYYESLDQCPVPSARSNLSQPNRGLLTQVLTLGSSMSRFG